jgi:hypothetical protein
MVLPIRDKPQTPRILDMDHIPVLANTYLIRYYTQLLGEKHIKHQKMCLLRLSCVVRMLVI